jgi:hypothetical protein
MNEKGNSKKHFPNTVLYQNAYNFLVVAKGIYLYRTSRETGFLVHHSAAYPYIIYFILIC